MRESKASSRECVMEVVGVVRTCISTDEHRRGHADARIYQLVFVRANTLSQLAAGSLGPPSVLACVPAPMYDAMSAKLYACALYMYSCMCIYA